MLHVQLKKFQRSNNTSLLGFRFVHLYSREILNYWNLLWFPLEWLPFFHQSMLFLGASGYSTVLIEFKLVSFGNVHNIEKEVISKQNVVRPQISLSSQQLLAMNDIEISFAEMITI